MISNQAILPAVSIGGSMEKEQVSGFRQMLVEATSIVSIPSFSCMILEEHPFNISSPGLLFYVDGATRESARGFIRLTSWAMTNNCLGMYIPVTVLRVIYAETETEGEHRVYYEAVIGDRHYMIAGCTDCSGTGRVGKRMMDDHFASLSLLQDIKIEHYHSKFPRSEQVYQQRLPDMIHAAKQENKRRRRDFERKLRKLPSFRAGDCVWLTGECLLANERIENKAYKVVRVENIPNYCSCGLGDDLGTSISVHPEQKCNLRRRFEALHHQLVTLDLGGGVTRIFTGHYLVHDLLLAPRR
jgi:hypothetical protein